MRLQRSHCSLCQTISTLHLPSTGSLYRVARIVRSARERLTLIASTVTVIEGLRASLWKCTALIASSGASSLRSRVLSVQVFTCFVAPQLGHWTFFTRLSQVNQGVLPILHRVHNPVLSDGWPHFGQKLSFMLGVIAGRSVRAALSRS